MTLTPDARRKLVGLLGRLGSDNDNERLAAVRLIEAGRKALGAQWEDLIVQPLTVAAYREAPLDFNTAHAPKPRSNGGMVCDLFDEVEAFADLLDAASDGASSEKEVDFVADIQERFDKYGSRTFISEAQLAWLRALAGR